MTTLQVKRMVQAVKRQTAKAQAQVDALRKLELANSRRNETERTLYDLQKKHGMIKIDRFESDPLGLDS